MPLAPWRLALQGLLVLLAVVLLEPGWAAILTAAPADPTAAALAGVAPVASPATSPHRLALRIGLRGPGQAAATPAPVLRRLGHDPHSLVLMVGPFKIIPAFQRLTARADRATRNRMAW